ncbi:MAG TPA: zinc ribbon domain-containing protein [Gemmatimonadaceae bacterium]|nr:zinc ribbon domain-containing protein [Gemmatimonadaceae bacterium]
MNPATEKQCPQCDAIVPKSAQVCPQCGSPLNLPPIAQPGSTNKVLIGCLIAAGAAFLLVVVIGIIAAIAIPKFANTKQKAYVAEMKSDLRNLATAEERYWTDHRRYQASVDSLEGFTFSHGVTLARPIEAGADGWTATVRREESPATCTIGVGDRVPAGGQEGTPACTR